MSPLRILALTVVLAVASATTPVQAEGFLSRMRGNWKRSSTPSQRYETQTRRYPTRNLNQGRTRLPAGRSYYQGRYYGNFNNRFYGPQYGYF